MKSRHIRAKATWILFIFIIGLSAAGCSSNMPEPVNVNANVSQNNSNAQPDSQSFVNKVWQVSASNAVSQGQLYTFLSEGTLVIASPNSNPAFGKWTYKDGKLTMIEEGISYQTDILKLTADEFNIRMHNPGEAVEIKLIPAEQTPLPK